MAQITAALVGASFGGSIQKNLEFLQPVPVLHEFPDADLRTLAAFSMCCFEQHQRSRIKRESPAREPFAFSGCECQATASSSSARLFRGVFTARLTRYASMDVGVLPTIRALHQFVLQRSDCRERHVTCLFRSSPGPESSGT
ncbi:hypothetical protein [Stenotrophomonas sp.]|uniref:hypothetical protein n=1 Tax=Stenotrophomonas sp. TaxID=69392 RepID=UPI0028B123CC|nr:hypothetical protein [Stenotrophomonas sp.]